MGEEIEVAYLVGWADAAKYFFDTAYASFEAAKAADASGETAAGAALDELSANKLDVLGREFKKKAAIFRLKSNGTSDTFCKT